MTALDDLELHRNELPDGPDPSALAAAREALGRAHSYPGWDAYDLREELGARYGVPATWLVVAAGSVSVIRQVMAAAEPGEVIIPWPSFDALPALAASLGHRPVLTNLCPRTGESDLDEVRARLCARTSLVAVCAPHSPTGAVLRHQDVLAFLHDVPERTLVLIDRAYAEFSDHPDSPRDIELVAAHPRAVVTRTFSKAYGLAGLRIGYGLAQPALVTQIARQGVPYPISAVAEAAAIQALRRPERLQRVVGRIRAERSSLAHRLRDLGVPVVIGHGNFVWVPLPEHAHRIGEHFAERGVLIRAYAGHGIRISVGTRADSDRVVAEWPEMGTGWRARDAAPGAAASCVRGDRNRSPRTHHMCERCSAGRRSRWVSRPGSRSRS